jgi:hypothetical protein
MKHIKRFNESGTSNLSFNDKYSNYIKSGDIVIDNKRDYIDIKIKGDINIPELLELGFNKEGDNYWIRKPMKFDFEDVISIDVPQLEKMLMKTPEEIKSELQAIYDQRYKNNNEYLKKIEIRKLFSEYL